MEFISTWLPRIIAGILSILDASRLRGRVAEMQEEHELMWTALDDIKRIYKDQPSGKFAEEALKKINGKYGR